MGIIARILLNSLLFNKYINMLIVLILLLGIFITIGYILKIKQINYFKQWILKKK